MRLLLPLGLAVLLLICAASCGGSANGSGVRRVEFVVTGSAPNGVDIRYGDDASNSEGSLPLDVTKPLGKNTLYWVMAQLHGGGRITCKVIVGRTVSAGHAVGGYNTCTAQSPSDALGGWN